MYVCVCVQVCEHVAMSRSDVNINVIFYCFPFFTLFKQKHTHLARFAD